MGKTADSEVFAPGLMRGRVALVTGGGTGLGRATAIELARCGAGVVVAGRREEPLRETVGAVNEMCALGDGAVAGGAMGGGAVAGGAVAGGAVAGGATAGEAEWVIGDVRDPEDAARLVRTVLERNGRLDVLVNNAGGQYFVPAEAIAAKGWRAVWRLNVDGTANMARAAYELAMRPQGAGTIVNVTLSPHHGMPGMAHSGAARAAVEALTRELAGSWAPHGVTVSAVAAGHFETDALRKYPESVRAGVARSIPAQRLGAPREHAWLVALLASPLGRAFSGSTVTLDGARDNWLGPWPPVGMAGESGEVPTEERRGAGG
jgi:citronellol/citronellal dehydrogenase